MTSAPSANTPDTTNFKELRLLEGDATIVSDKTETYEAISSMVVELSMSTNRSLHSFPSSAATSIMLEPEPNETFHRKPSLRASQVFSFINERRARRKSEGTEVVLNTGVLSAQETKQNPSRAQTWSRKSSPHGSPDSLESEFQSVEQMINPLPPSHLSALALPAPAPESPMPFNPLSPAPRTRASSTGAADALRACEVPKARPSRRRVGGSAGADTTLFITRDELMQKLLDQGVSSRRGIMAIHREIPYRDERWDAQLPVTNLVTDSSIVLPLFYEMTEDEQDYVMDCVEAIGS